MPSGELAGAEGFEPPLAVLETAGLPLNLRPYSRGQGLLTLSVAYLISLCAMVLAAERAELLQLQPLRRGLLVLHAGVVLTLTLGALQRNLFSRP